MPRNDYWFWSESHLLRDSISNAVGLGWVDGFRSAPPCILIAFAYCTLTINTLSLARTPQLMHSHSRISSHPGSVMDFVYCLFIALLINCRLYLCQFRFPLPKATHLCTSPLVSRTRTWPRPWPGLGICPFFLWMTGGLVNNKACVLETVSRQSLLLRPNEISSWNKVSIRVFWVSFYEFFITVI